MFSSEELDFRYLMQRYFSVARSTDFEINRFILLWIIALKIMILSRI